MSCPQVLEVLHACFPPKHLQLEDFFDPASEGFYHLLRPLQAARYRY